MGTLHTETFTIPAGASASNSIVCASPLRLAGVITPATLESGTAAFAFEVTTDLASSDSSCTWLPLACGANLTLLPLHSATQAEMVLGTPGSNGWPADANLLKAARRVRIVACDAGGTPVSQTNEQVIVPLWV